MAQTAELLEQPAEKGIKSDLLQEMFKKLGNKLAESLILNRLNHWRLH